MASEDEEKNLNDRLGHLIDPTPIINDPEDALNLDTVARVVNRFEDENEDVGYQKSGLRIKNAGLLDEEERYKGKRISVKKFKELNLGQEEAEESDEEEDEEEDMEFEYSVKEFRDKLKSSKRFSDKESEDSQSASDEDDNDDDDEGDDDDEDDGDEDELDEEEMNKDEKPETELMENLSKLNVGSEIEKGKATRSQLLLCDSLLECRIKYQKVLQAGNQLPQFDVLPEFKRDKQYRKTSRETSKKLEKLLRKLVTLQTLLLKKHPDTRKCIMTNSEEKMQEDDEEIPSNSDVEADVEENNEIGLERKLKFNEYPDFLSKRHKDFENFRNVTIQKWNDRTKLVSGKFNVKSFAAFDQSALKQIEQILSDKPRLIRRTWTKRTIYRVLGKIEKENKEASNESSSKNDDNLDPEIFDDNDFYHKLLSEVIERKGQLDDPTATAQKVVAIAKLRGRTARNIDTKASKGRRIRYKTHSKLVNFMAPFDNSSMSNEARDQLFISLFGRKCH